MGGGGSKLNSRFITLERYSFKPSKLKELTKIGGGCAHVCVGGSTVVIYKSRHVILEMFANMENLFITSSSLCNMHNHQQMIQVNKNVYPSPLDHLVD